jgi:hypothetical protein
MARRAAPPHQPAYLTGRPGPAHDPNEGFFSRFLREQIFAPDKLPGNISLVTGVSVFVGGIVAVRTWGEMMVPA